VDGTDIWSKKYSLTTLRRRIGLVFQFPESQLFEETVYRDVAFGPGNLQLSKEEIDRRVHHALSLVGLDTAIFGDCSPFRLSEGEKRKAAIAGVLAMQPEMVVLDEPTAGLDPMGIQSIADILQSLQQQGSTPVFITHNMDFVAEVAQRVIVLLDGGVLFDGSPAELFADQHALEQASLELPNFIRAFAPYRSLLPAAFQSVISYRRLLQLLQSHPEIP
jgi:energy-coupling factor transport system ATP-binding protein